MKVISMFGLRLIYDRDKVESIAIRCRNCKKKTGLYLGTSNLEEMITKFVLNSILYHVDMSWIICSNEEMLYEIVKSNHTNFLNKGPWYNTAICSRLHVNLLEDFIIYSRTN